MVWPQARTAPGLTQRGVCVTNADVIRPRRLCVNLNMKKTDQTLLGDGLVLDAASGAAPKALLVLAQSQAALRADARERLDCVEAAFGSLLEQSPEAELSADLFDQTVGELDNASGVQDERDAQGMAEGGLPAPIAHALMGQKERGWKRRFGGLQERVIDSLCEPGIRARLVRIPPGAGTIEHGHEGDEHTLVLSGAFVDEHGSYDVGDACVAGPNEVHHPRVEGSKACICFVVECGALKPTNPALAAANRIFGGRYF